MSIPLFLKVKRKLYRNYLYLIIICFVPLFSIGCEPNQRTVEKTTNQEELAKIALTSKNHKVKVAAVEKINDQNLLKEVATSSVNRNFKKFVAEKITDQTILADIVLSSEIGDPLIDLYKLVTDPNILAKIAIETKFKSISSLAGFRIIKLNNNELSKNDLKAGSTIFHFKSEFEGIPDLRSMNIIRGILPALDILCDPIVIKKLGKIQSLKIHWSQLERWYSFTGSGSKDILMKGERVTCSIKLEKQSLSWSHTWESKFPSVLTNITQHQRDYGLSFNECQIRPSELLIARKLPHSVFERIARESNNIKLQKWAEKKVRNALESENEYNSPGYSRKSIGGRVSLVRRIRDIELLTKIAKEDDLSPVRAVATELLGEMGTESTFDALTLIIKDNSPDVRIAAVKALGMVDEKRAGEVLFLALVDENENVSREALFALSKLGDKRAIDPLILQLKNEDSIIRRNAIKALGWISDKRAVDLIIETLNDKETKVRVSAIETLAKIDAPRVIDTLILALKHEDTSVRWSAILALNESNDERVVIPLLRSSVLDFENRRLFPGSIGTLSISDYKIRNPKALETLGKMEPSIKVKKLIGALINTEDVLIRSRATDYLILLGSEAIEPLINILDNPSEFVRDDVVRALGYIGDKKAAIPVSKLLSDTRWRAVKVLETIGDERFIEPALNALKDTNHRVRSQAISLIYHIGGPKAVDGLINFIKDQNVHRVEAKQKLRWLEASERARGNFKTADKARDFLAL